jgi:hypothetical protein
VQEPRSNHCPRKTGMFLLASLIRGNDCVSSDRIVHGPVYLFHQSRNKSYVVCSIVHRRLLKRLYNNYRSLPRT